MQLKFERRLTVVFTLLLTMSAIEAVAGPTINDVIPNSGPVGTDVTIVGTGFSGPNDVKFGGIKATVTQESATSLRVKVPTGASNGQISVTNGGNTATSPNNFTVTTPIPSNIGTIGKGDRIKLKTAVDGFMPTQNRCFGKNSSGKPVAPVPALSQYYAPAGSVLTLDSDVYFDADSIQKVMVSFRGCRLISAYIGNCQEPAQACNDEQVVEGNQYSVAVEKIERAATSSTGFDYGTIIVPFKYHFNDNTITGNSTIGQYLGYKFTSSGISLMPVISAGLGVVSLSQQNSQQGNTTSSAPSFSVAYGVIVNILKNGLFQVGIMSGWDWAGKGRQYEYEGKPWISISLGTNWTN